MQCGSTGLGKKALQMKLEDEKNMTKLPPTQPSEGSLVIYCKTTHPVVWNVWIGIEPEDIGFLIKIALSRTTIAFVFKSLAKLVGSKIGFKKKSTKGDVELVGKPEAT